MDGRENRGRVRRMERGSRGGRTCGGRGDPLRRAGKMRVVGLLAQSSFPRGNLPSSGEGRSAHLWCGDA